MLLKPVSPDVPLITRARALCFVVALLGVPNLFLTFVHAQSNVLKYLELNDIGATPAEILLSPDFQTIIEFEGLAVQSASSGRADQITVELSEQTIRLRANQDTVNTDLTVVAGGKTALFILRSDPASNTPRRYVVRNSPPPTPAGLGYQGVEGEFDLDSLQLGTRELPPGVALDLTARMDNKGDVTLQYTLSNDGEVAIVNDPSRLNLLNEDIKLRYALSRVPPAGSVNVIRPGQSESGTILVPNPPNGKLTFVWVFVQLGPGGQYAAIVDVSELLAAPVGTTATVGEPAATTATPPATEAQTTEAQTTPAPATTEQTVTPQTASVDTSAAQLGAGVAVYEHTDFTGASALLEGTGPISFYRADQGQFGAVPDNAISSLIVSEGYSILLCDVQATFPCQQYGPGSYPSLDPKLNDIFSFAQVSVLPVMQTTTSEAAPARALNLVANGGFDAADANHWYLWMNPDFGVKTQGNVIEGRYCITTEASTTDPNSAALGQSGLALDPDTTYTLEFDYQADRVARFAVVTRKEGDPWTEYFRQDLTADAGVQHFEGSFTSPGAEPNTGVLFWVGANEAGTNVCLDNVTLTPTPAPDVAAEAAPAADERVFIEDALPDGAIANNGEDGWNWVSSNPAPFSGQSAHQSINNPEAHQHFFTNASEPLTVGANDILFAYVYLDPVNPPNQVMLQWNVADSWEHRAYWGANNLPWGEDSTPSRHRVGDLPSPGQWVRLEVPAAAVGLVDQQVNGMAFSLHGGQATWDKAGAVDTTQSEQALAQTEQLVNTEEAVATPGLAGTYSLAAAHSGLCVDVVKFSQDNGGQILQWNCNNEINQRWTLQPQGDYYNVAAEHSKKCLDVDAASLDDGHKVHQWECVGVENQLWSIKQVASGYQLIAKHSGKCLVVQDGSLEVGAGLVQWSCTDGGQATNDVFALNPTEPAPDAPVATAPAPASVGDNLVVNPSFDDPLSNAWEGNFFEGARGIAKVIDSEYCFNTLNAGPFTNATRLIQFGLPLESEQSYVLSFEAYADKPRTINARVGQNYEPWTLHHQEYFTVSEKKQSYTMVLKVPVTQDPTSYLEFALGGRLGTNPPFRVCVDNISVKKAEAGIQATTPNLLGNPNFDDTVGTLWQGWFDGGGGSQGLSAINNGEYCMKVTNGGTNSWGAQITQRDFPLEANQPYTLSFEARADQPRRIHVRVAQGYEPWTPFHEQDFDIGQEKQTYTTSFTMSATSEGNSGLEFWMGGELATNPPFTMCFDNIVITKSNVTAAQ